MRTLTREVECGPTYAHVNPIGGDLGGLPTMPPMGFSCALKGYHCQQEGPATVTASHDCYHRNTISPRGSAAPRMLPYAHVGPMTCTWTL